MSTLLHLSAVEADIAGSRILRGVELAINTGEVVALMGRNGVGKTTTLKTITGLLDIRQGAITFAGQVIDRWPIDERARLGIAYVPQGRDIFPHLTVAENLQIGLVVHGRKGASAAAALAHIYELFPVLHEMLARKGGVLSGGQQQQLAIARALLCDPKLLILDEPTEGIQPSIIEQIGDTLRRLRTVPRRDGTPLSILLVEQYVDFCRAVADRFYALDRGTVVASGSIETLTDDVVRTHLQV